MVFLFFFLGVFSKIIEKKTEKHCHFHLCAHILNPPINDKTATCITKTPLRNHNHCNRTPKGPNTSREWACTKKPQNQHLQGIAWTFRGNPMDFCILPDLNDLIQVTKGFWLSGAASAAPALRKGRSPAATRSPRMRGT